MTRPDTVCNGTGYLWISSGNRPDLPQAPDASTGVLCWRCLGKGYIQERDSDIVLGENESDLA